MVGVRSKEGHCERTGYIYWPPLCDDVRVEARGVASTTWSATAMAGPNLEAFKFGLYVFFPVIMLLKYGDSEWYQNNVVPVSIPATLQETVAWLPRTTVQEQGVSAGGKDRSGVFANAHMHEHL